MHGATHKHAADPTGDVVRPCDYLATVFHLLGFSSETLVHDVEGRPTPISRGQIVKSVLA